MKNIIYLVLMVIPFMFSCNQAELDRLKSENDSLRSTSNKGDVQVSEFIQSFNQIQENLNMIKEKENIISMKTKNENELGTDAKNQINEDILSIYELMLKNKQTIEKLNKKLKASDSKNATLEKTIKLMTEQMAQKDVEINTLKDQLAKLNFDVAELNKQVTQMTENITNLEQENQSKNQVINDQDQKINTAFYVYGTKKELKSKGVISKDGLFDIKIAENVNKDYFTKIDIRETKTIQLSTKDVEILSTHPAGSYKLNKNGKKVESLEIVDFEKFWEVSKYLIIVTN